MVRVPGCAKKAGLLTLPYWCARTEVSAEKASGGRFFKRSRREQGVSRAECIEAIADDYASHDTRTSREAAWFGSPGAQKKRVC